jgi:hypothetical protein
LTLEEQDTATEILGKTFTDDVTGFSGVATSVCFNLHGETLVHLENESNSRWVETNRLKS